MVEVVEREKEQAAIKSILAALHLSNDDRKAFPGFWPSVTFMNSAGGNLVFGLFDHRKVNHGK